MRLGFRSFMGPPWPVGVQRAVTHLMTVMLPCFGGVKVEKLTLPSPAGGMRCERVTPAAAVASGKRPDHAVLFLHGGAFCVGSPRTHRVLTTCLASLTGAEVLVPHYRRTPESPFPAQIEDALAAYQALLARGYTPERIAVAGDSAGGSLSILLPLALRQRGQAMPACLVLMSPFTDTKVTSPSKRERRELDPVLRLSWVHQAASWYGEQADHPLAAPMQEALGALPPTLVQVGTDEILHDDGVLFAQVAAGQGNQIELEIYQDRWHVFQMLARVLPSAAAAMESQARFMRKQWA